MKITQQNVPTHELIGLSVEIVDSNDPSLRKLKGNVVYETKNLLMIRADEMVKRVPKNIITISVRLPDGNHCTLDGRVLVARPEDRIQRL